MAYRFYIACVLLAACDSSPLNNPYQNRDSNGKILYSSFGERPKRLDPATSYSSNEYTFIGQIYEPPLQYHYLKRPYQLIPLTASQMPTVSYFDQHGTALPDNAAASKIAYTEYLINLRPDVYYQPHPAFDAQNRRLSAKQLADISTLAQLPARAKRQLVAEDYIYQIKRLAHPKSQSPIAGLMKSHIAGFANFADKTADMDAAAIRDVPLAGAVAVGDYQYKIRINGKYPQFIYWLAMPFFAPMAWEAVEFYSQDGLQDKNITLNWYPVGTGAYFLAENNPNRRMVLVANPNYHHDSYPSEGAAGDSDLGLLDDAGAKIPFIDEVRFILEKETIPYWNKFLQGYYDSSGIGSESFDQAIEFDASGQAGLSKTMQDKNIQLQTSVSQTIHYMGFNMLDSVVGGASEAARKLRIAIAIAIDYEEYIAIFNNGRGVAAQGVLPPGIFGKLDGKDGINPYVYDWTGGKAKRKSIAEAVQLLAEAGYENGIDPATGEALVLYFDSSAAGVDERARLNWYVKQFNKLGINLVLRKTDYNRFQDKMRSGSSQIFSWGWNADYPDPENFFFLLASGNGKVKNGGENAANYSNLDFDRLFEKMRNMDNTPERQRIIGQMQEIVRRDSPWIFGFHPKSFALYHDWYSNIKPNPMAHNRLKYTKINPAARHHARQKWNNAVFLPLVLFLAVLVALLIPAVVAYRRKRRQVLG